MTQPAPPSDRPIAHTSLVFGGNLVSAALGFVASVLVMRGLGPQGFGVVIVATTVLTVLWQFTGRGFDQALVRFAARDEPPDGASRDEVCQTVHRHKLAWGGALGLLGLLAAWPITRAVVGSGESAVPVCVGAAGALAASLWGYVGACLQAARSYAAFTAVQVVNAAARLVLMGGLLLAGWLTPALAVAAALGGYGAGAALGYALIRPAQRRARRCEALQPRLIEAARWLVASSVIYLLYVRLDQMLLSALRGPEAAGVYGAAVAFIQLLDLLTGSLLAVYLPRFAEAIDSASLRRRAWESVRVAALLALPIGPALYLACPLIDAVLGPRYAATTGLMMVILPGAILNALTHALQSVLIVRGRARRLTVLDAAMLGANGIGNVLAIGRWGMTGAAAVALATRLAASAWLAALVVHELRRGSAGPTSPAAQRPR